MIAIEIVLLLIGMLFVLASFWVTEKLSSEELDHISELSKEEMGIILQHELDSLKVRVDEVIDDSIEESKDRTERSLEKQTHEKIMAINDYSDTVIEKMNKTHNEIMFLYSMLNDKHSELTKFSSGLTEQIQNFRSQEEELTNYYMDQLKQQGTKDLLRTEAVSGKASETADTKGKADPSKQLADKGGRSQAVMDAPHTGRKQDGDVKDVVEQNGSIDRKKEIFALYEQGKDSVSIAKKLGMGVGEVRLILGLYKGEYTGEV